MDDFFVFLILAIPLVAFFAIAGYIAEKWRK